MVRRGSTVRVRQRALKRPANGLFLLPESTAQVRQWPPDLPPKPVPSLTAVETLWLEQTAGAVTEHFHERLGGRHRAVPPVRLSPRVASDPRRRGEHSARD